MGIDNPNPEDKCKKNKQSSSGADDLKMEEFGADKPQVGERFQAVSSKTKSKAAPKKASAKPKKASATKKKKTTTKKKKSAKKETLSSLNITGIRDMKDVKKALGVLEKRLRSVERQSLSMINKVVETMRLKELYSKGNKMVYQAYKYTKDKCIGK